MQSVQPSPVHWNPHRGGTRSQIESPSSPMHRRPLGGWRRMSRDQAGNTHSRREGISPHYGGRSQVSQSRSGGAQRTRGWKGMRKRMSGPSSQQRSQTLEGWNGCPTLTGRRCAQCPSPDRSPTSDGRSPRRNGQKRDGGLEAGPPSRNTGYRKPTNRTPRSLEAPRGSPSGSTS